MDLGMVGLGRMGANMAERLVRGGHRVVGFVRKPSSRKGVEEKGAESAASLAGDLLVDGGNSNYKDTLRRAQMLAQEPGRNAPGDRVIQWAGKD
jgi:6-phosphogluconate dehydrogenase